MLLKKVTGLLKGWSQEERKFLKSFSRIIGKTPYNIRLYILAMKHASVSVQNESGFRESNERLEYLGDAILGAVVAEYLFKKYPFKDEGFLTEIRSRIVSRDSLNRLAVKIGLSELLAFEGIKKGAKSHKSIYGDAMEAFIGALYLDMGFAFCRKYIVRKLIMQHYDLNEIIGTTTNFKSLVIEWAQKNNKKLRFHPAELEGEKHNRQFKVQLEVGEKVKVEGKGLSKKKAEQDAARKASEILKLI